MSGKGEEGIGEGLGMRGNGKEREGKGKGRERDFLSRGVIKSGALNSRLNLPQLILNRRELRKSSLGCQLGMLQPRYARI